MGLVRIPLGLGRIPSVVGSLTGQVLLRVGWIGQNSFKVEMFESDFRMYSVGLVGISLDIGRLVRLPSGVGGVIDQNSFGCMWGNL